MLEFKGGEEQGVRVLLPNAEITLWFHQEDFVTIAKNKTKHENL